MNDSVVNYKVLDDFLKIDKTGKMSRKLISFFAESIPTGILKCKQAIKKRDYKKLKELAHYHRSTCNNVGAEVLGNCFYQIEINADNEKKQNLETIIEKLSDLFQQSLNEVVKYVDKH